MSAPISASSILKDAGQTLAQRGVDYDSRGGERSMAHAVQIFNAIVCRDAMTEEEGWIFMLALKQARMMRGKAKLDTYVDLSAYASLLGECAISNKSNGCEVSSNDTVTP